MGADPSLSGDGKVKFDEKQKWSTSTSHIVYHFGTSGLAVAMATAITHPLDVLKVRLQMQLAGQRGPLTGMGQLFVQLLKNEGPKSLYLGLTPALTRSVLYGGLRLGLYEPSKNACDWAFGSTNILLKIASGAFSGATATALTNPTEVLKVRLQMNSTLRQGGPIAEMHRLISEEGIMALWKGVGPAMARAAALTASQLQHMMNPSGSSSKHAIFHFEYPRHISVNANYFEDIEFEKQSVPLNLKRRSSTVAGIVSTFITAPVDMVKTRLMLQQESIKFGSYKNGFHCAYQVARTEGPKALYKGGFAVFARLGPQSAITFILCEKLRKLAGLDAI